MEPTRSLRLHNRHTGETLDLRRSRRGGETVLELNGTLPPHQEGPPVHIHTREDEEGRVIAGVLSAQIGGRRVEARPGESVQLPRGVPHRWWNASDLPLAFEGVASPLVDLDRYLQAVFEVLNAGPADRPPLFYLAHLSLRHRHTQRVLLVPPVVQTVLFPALVALGNALGRYRGDAWPGAPARATGAPE